MMGQAPQTTLEGHHNVAFEKTAACADRKASCENDHLDDAMTAR